MTEQKQRELGFEKCYNPYDLTDDEKNYLDNDFDEENDLEVENQFNSNGNMQGLITPMGIIPIVENTNPFKIFDFWICHTNFKITQDIAKTIDETDGVEVFDIFTPYRFRIAIGRAFASGPVKEDIMKRLNAKVSKHMQSQVLDTTKNED